MDWFKLPLDVIWKHDMGERYWTWGRLICQTLFIKFIVSFMLLFFFPDQAVLPITHMVTLRDYLPLITTDGFLLLVWIFGVANLLEIRKRRKAGVRYYSYYWGTPRFFPDKPIVHWLIIPLGSGLVAYGIFCLFHALGIYLFLLTAMQFLYAADCYRSNRIEKINRKDREILMDIKTAELEQSNHAGLDMVRIAKPSQRARRPEETEQFEARWKKVLKSSDYSQN
jgi:hypothetical protein